MNSKENDSNILTNLLSEENTVEEIAVPISQPTEIQENDNKTEPVEAQENDNKTEPAAEAQEKAENAEPEVHPTESNTADDSNINAVVCPETIQTIPELTKYEVTCKCCCGIDPCVKIQDKDPVPRSFWGSHELDSICMNVFVSGIIIFVELVHFLIVFPKLAYTSNSSDDGFHYSISHVYKYQIPCLALHIFTLILFLWAYFAAACMDPGFLPYNWFETRKTKYNWQEQLSGLAIREDQVQYAYDHRPNIASFSKSAGRFVIRADHICGWIGNWVGKRNHKQFILMNFWGSMYALNLFVWHIPIIQQIMPSEDHSLFFVYILLVFFEGCVEIVFAILLFYVFIMSLDDLRKDLTKIKKWKNEKGQDYSCLKATREVFGPGNICCFVFPTPAFSDVIVFDQQIQESPTNFALD